MRPVMFVVVAVVSTLSCGDGGGGVPSSPTPQPDPQPLPQTWTLSGTISETAPTASARIANATVTIASGPDAGRSVRSDANGVFQLEGLQPAQFTVRTQAANYVEGSQFVTLTGNQTIAIGLDPVFQMVTTTRDDSVSGGDACPGYWDGSYSAQTDTGRSAAIAECEVHYVFDVHHDGTLSTVLSWTNRETNLSTELYYSDQGQPTGQGISPRGDRSRQPVSYDVDAHTQYVVRVRNLSPGGGSPPAGITAFTLTVTRPN
jgi:Carboxypeptidase regulatory-like domain